MSRLRVDPLRLDKPPTTTQGWVWLIIEAFEIHMEQSRGPRAPIDIDVRMGERNEELLSVRIAVAKVYEAEAEVTVGELKEAASVGSTLDRMFCEMLDDIIIQVRLVNGIPESA